MLSLVKFSFMEKREGWVRQFCRMSPNLSLLYTYGSLAPVTSKASVARNRTTHFLTKLTIHWGSEITTKLHFPSDFLYQPWCPTWIQQIRLPVLTATSVTCPNEAALWSVEFMEGPGCRIKQWVFGLVKTRKGLVVLGFLSCDSLFVHFFGLCFHSSLEMLRRWCHSAV